MVSAAATCVGVGRGGGGVSRRQWRELESAEHLSTQLSSPTAVSTVVWLPPRVSVSVEAAVVSADGSGESWSPRSHFDPALLADGSDDSRSAASTCVSVAGGASTC